MFMCSLKIRYMLIIVTLLNRASTAQLQCIYKLLPFRYLIDSVSLLGSFGSWFLLVYLTRSKPAVNKVLIILLLLLLLSLLLLLEVCRMPFGVCVYKIKV